MTSRLEHLDPTRLPHHGGDATTVMITMTLDQLRAEVATAEILDGEAATAISGAELRRLACTAGIIPAVLGGRSEILDLGRTRRLFNGAQRKALRLRDRQCRAEGCAIPATWCEAHHLEARALGGRTDLADGALLCAHHHHRAHDQRVRRRPPAQRGPPIPPADVTTCVSFGCGGLTTSHSWTRSPTLRLPPTSRT